MLTLRRTMISLFSGAIVALMIHLSLISELELGRAATDFLNFTTVAISRSHNIFAIVAWFGGLLGLFKVTGGLESVRKWLVQKSAKFIHLFTYGMGIALFFDDYISYLLSHEMGSKSLNEKSGNRDHREDKLRSGIILSTTAIMPCLLIPLSTWVLYINGSSMQLDLEFFNLPHLFLFFSYPFLMMILAMLVIYRRITFERQEKAFETEEQKLYNKFIINTFLYLFICAVYWIVNKLKNKKILSYLEYLWNSFFMFTFISCIVSFLYNLLILNDYRNAIAQSVDLSGNIITFFLPYLLLFYIPIGFLKNEAERWYDVMKQLRYKEEPSKDEVLMLSMLQRVFKAYDPRKLYEAFERIEHEPAKRSSAFFFFPLFVFVGLSIFMVFVGNPYALEFSLWLTLLLVFFLIACQAFGGTNIRRYLLDSFKLMSKFATEMIPLLGIILFALVLRELGEITGIFNPIRSTLSGQVSWSIPPFLFALSSILAFLTGTSFGTYAVFIPIVDGLCASVLIRVLSFVAVLSGGALGNQSSFVGDIPTGVCNRLEITVYEHIRSLAPYVMVATAVSFVSYFIVGYWFG